MKSPDIFKKIVDVSKKTSTDVYAVGGFVRDSLMGKVDSKDIDFVVGGSGLEFAKEFAAEVGEDAGTLVEFPDFDTARFTFTKAHSKENENGESYIEKEILFEIEFAGARTEEYDAASRKPVVQPTSIEDDLQRRDFTVNAIAQKIMAGGKLGAVIDPCNGQQAIQDKVLQTPLEPNETFSDDPLRMMRAARFAAQLDFSIAPAVLEAMHTNAERLSIVSAERIQEELMKLMKTDRPSIGLTLLHATSLMDYFLPEVCQLSGVEEVKGYSHKDNLGHTFAVVDNIAEQSAKPLLRFTGLLHDIAKPQTKKFEKGRGWTFDMHEHLGRKMAKDIMRRLRFSSKDIYYVSELVRWHLQPIALMDKGVTDSAVRRLIVGLGDMLPDLLVLCRADITTGNQTKKERRLKNYDYLDERIGEVIVTDKLREFQSPVRGEEIMQMCGLKPGPTVGKMKNAIEEAILEGDIPNEYDAARAYFDSIKEKYIADAEPWELV
ncbi:MAG: tRNA nucleotidyltransferase [Candidatus Magasanikbacteria bacterium CG10_big_fil_rev_8_21_14_0_10_47_10]|uniref:tRNA nucleotidyltransferase n=1 Tax=Candidatus Magasanikbacteria bacterium CG10_big_fil_rev_8_21_14_0_10_47_10 TaxID=1974652 RepID=A0A2H0TS31_9BACT|nr:MAG: tRNA nucleotidyltransferase [Candidatus Magasanikbacteria bacterium CG10_big_fil_rev_8_21_14_0_10_47_10]